MAVPEVPHCQPRKESQHREGGVGRGQVGNPEQGGGQDNAPYPGKTVSQHGLNPSPEKGLFRHGCRESGENRSGNCSEGRRKKAVTEKEKGSGRQGQQGQKRNCGNVPKGMAVCFPDQPEGFPAVSGQGAPAVREIEKKGEDQQFLHLFFRPAFLKTP